MFELDIASPTRVRVSVGRWTFRSWRSFVMRAPKGYKAPRTLFVVEQYDGDHVFGQYGAFFERDEAERCVAKLEGEGRTEIVINMIGAYERLADWEWDR